jgi:hypothetical protein
VKLLFLLLAAYANASPTPTITYAKRELRASLQVEKYRDGLKEIPSYENWDIWCTGAVCSLEQVVVRRGKRGCVFERRRYSPAAGTLAVKKLSVKEGVLDFSFGDPGAEFAVHVSFLKNGPNAARVLKEFTAAGSWSDVVAWEYRLAAYLDDFQPDCRYLDEKSRMAP